jgi:hypothetical protein
MLSSKKQREMRDLLLLLFWLHHYLPIQTLEVIFDLSKSLIHRILMKQLNLVEKMKDKWISLDNWEVNDVPSPFPCHIGIIDCTEIRINN